MGPGQTKPIETSFGKKDIETLRLIFDKIAGTDKTVTLEKLSVSFFYSLELFLCFQTFFC